MASTSSHAEGRCIPAIDWKLFELGCLGPALTIILILASLNRRKQFKLEYCNGYPGLLIPVNFLGSFSRHNRFSIAATFGATASTCLTLFLGKNETSFIASADSPVRKVFQALIFTLVYGIVFYPFFACLTTDYKLVGSVLGFLYAVIRFFLTLVIDFQCHSSFKGDTKTLFVGGRLGAIPTYMCLLFIVIRFAVLVYMEVRRKWFPLASDIYRAKQASQISLVGDSGMKHVKHLFNPGLNLSAAERRWFMKPILFLYKPRSDFKFCTQLISTLVVAVITVFQCFVAFLVFFDVYKKASMRLCSGYGLNCFHVVMSASAQAAFTFSAVISILMLLHFMRCHRDHVLQLCRGQRKFFEGVSASPQKLVGKSLRFSGFQIAYALAGFLILGIFLSGLFSAMGLLFKYPSFYERVKRWAIGLLPSAGMAFFLWLFQKFLAHFVFRDREFPNITITVDNRRFFSIMSYFFFFYNILLGLFSCLVRILIGMVLGVVFLCRIDRTCFMRGFQTFDRAFVAYLGFINVLVAHSHPVMLVFCQLLINRNKDRQLEESKPNDQVVHVQQQSSKDADNCVVYARQPRLPRLSQKAVNRWHVAVMLLRYPSLIQYRKQTGVTPSLDLGSINTDISALV